MFFERLYRGGGEPDGAPALLGLRLPQREGSTLPGEGTPHAQHAPLKVDVVPFERKELALAHPRVEGENIEGLESVGGLPNCLEEPAGLLRYQGVYLLGGDPRQLEAGRGIARYQPVRYGGFQSLVQDSVDLVHRCGCESRVEALPVEEARVGGVQVFKPDASQGW